MAKKPRTNIHDQARKNGLKYIGGNSGRHLSGIAMRDLSKEEVGRLSDKQFSDCLDSGLYEVK